MYLNKIFGKYSYLGKVTKHGFNGKSQLQNKRVFNTLNKLSNKDEACILQKAEKYGSYVKEGYEFKVGIWLNTCSLLVLGMITLGGYTRLTESGLSITDWKVNGIKYPQNDEEWINEFEKYKLTPEYKEVHYNMSLEEYKKIFFNEWLHRTVGRGIGLYFISGVTYFLCRNSLKKNMLKKLSFIFGLGAFQGFVGWWMVKSGFKKPETENKTPRVSPYRLVFHLFCATATYSYLFLNSLKLIEIGKLRKMFLNSSSKNWNEFLLNELKKEFHEKKQITKGMKFGLFSLAFLILSNIMYGGFVAGNDAGYAYNTWPKMIDKYIPDEVKKFYTDNITQYKQLFENTAIVQFNHRMLSYTIVLNSFLLYFYSKTMALTKKTKKHFVILPFITTTQMVTGISVLVHHVPIPLALVHQFGGFAVLTTILHLLKKSCFKL
ncbi:cytochrome c oxidase assembly protein COX15, putative [Plasmodium chabaudi chabaudi]|uniref:Cytochrome c oxidase assembly protein COX15, putative n=1 Tax=Plasmodium chabaudi chabaudi TaxID=31271 RepID=A0A4V0K0N6_PLACU|nr:cytochrome c oxidase assembly protein COX15, putative [Plasmodium chabaudi chabaudi]VTZ66443.1 cytochrome c oxidase assembly protein COX15, putative [Plasmodium chabaudi chabaudi]|eukprot:XP_740600.2 cytochrome c oxidase assembly protein, putative [Plasmodium chabaudi chabaudi]